MERSDSPAARQLLALTLHPQHIDAVRRWSHLLCNSGKGAHAALQVLALMLIRQRNMRITVTSFVEEMARVVPPLRRQLALTRRDFRQRFLAEEEMLNALTPPGFDAAARVRPCPAPMLQRSHLCVGNREGRAGAMQLQG